MLKIYDEDAFFNTHSYVVNLELEKKRKIVSESLPITFNKKSEYSKEEKTFHQEKETKEEEFGEIFEKELAKTRTK